MTTTESAQKLFHTAFARHETFHPRYGWLKKGFDQASADAGVFTAADATTQLGVGKNMVAAIRYWCLAYDVLEEVKNDSNPRILDARPSTFGDQLMGDEGWDPYLEDPGSLWLLHWHLLRPPCRAPSWWAVFNEIGAREFDEDDLVDGLKRFRDSHDQWSEIVDGSLEKDVRCLLRMYGSATQGRDLPEDSVDSPFSELDLFRRAVDGRKRWTLNVGPKRSLPDAILMHACLDYSSIVDSDARVLGVASLALNEQSPGKAFCLTESAIGDAIARFTERHKSDLSLTSAAGNLQLAIPEDSESEKQRILADYFAGGKR